ncbi:hypothetical protein MKS88_005858 [Plasmodium brasilianum]|uniref:Uncharacterized protein n=2 Tax=Plasmodium (Plasmodium) TaxID=418103 RepID=A0A1A8X752_PLAMA|nr:conserved Plasmodium protein, unknown function [Plasmodium malariae]KAI4835171.1 hypothetical protein MKS88_005858 [Plasmodium brasilianum]SBT01072.1 hypothetical protein PMALA_079620 [Plasmodium malariae]SCP03755.1 conserved Plasmodium protein, unknown function [Plasmodium malariae]
MKRITDFYIYSKDRSATVFNLTKNVETKKKKSKSSWLEKLCCEFEKTKNDTLEYFTIIKNKWKNNISSCKFPTFFNYYNSKYRNFPWYKKLYYILKDQVYKLLNIRQAEKMEKVQVEKEEKGEEEEMKRHELYTDENKITRDFISYENLDYKNKQKQKNSGDSIFRKYREKLRKTKENETYLSERSKSELVKRNTSSSSSCITGFISHKKIVDDVNTLIDTSSLVDKVNENSCGPKNIKDVDSNNIINNKYKNMNSFLNVEKSPKFNIKNTWEKLSGYIS